MKCVWFLAAVVFIQFFHGAESSPDSFLSETAALARAKRNVFTKAIKKIKKFATELFEKLKTVVKGFARKVESFVTSTWENLHGQLKTALQKIDDKHQKIDQYTQSLLVKFAAFGEGNLSKEEKTKVLEDLQKVEDTENEFMRDLGSSSSNKCVKDVVNQAKALRENNLKQYIVCKDSAIGGLKEIGKFLWSSAKTLAPNVIKAVAKGVVKNYFGVAMAIKDIIFNDMKDVVKSGKIMYENTKKHVEQGSTCVLNVFDRSKQRWDELIARKEKCPRR